MSEKRNPFASIAEAARVKAANSAEARQSAPSAPGERAPASAHAPSAAFHESEPLKERVLRLQRELEDSADQREDLRREMERLRGLSANDAPQPDTRLVFIGPEGVVDRLPRDRSEAAFSDDAFEELLADIREHGQNDPITVREGKGDGAPYEIAAGRRRLRACKALGRDVLARVRALDDEDMLRVQFAENERRSDVTAIDRSRWFAAVYKAAGDSIGQKVNQKAFAARFGMDPSTLSLHLRNARFPDEILDRLPDRGKLSMLKARRVMDPYDKDPAGTLARMTEALDAYEAQMRHPAAGQKEGGEVDAVMRAAEGKPPAKPSGKDAPAHVLHDGRRIGSLARNGKHWVFRFATAMTDKEVESLIDRLRSPISKQ